MRYANKSAFEESVRESWAQLIEACESLTEDQFCTRRKLQSKTNLSWSPKDVCGHVYAWHRLLLGWYRDGENSRVVHLPAKGFNWRQTPALNRQLFLELQKVPANSIVRRMKLSHGRVVKLVNSLTDRQLMKPGHVAWTGKLGLISYVSANTDSHYRWAIKKIRKISAAS